MEELYDEHAIDEFEDDDALFHRHVIGEEHDLKLIDALLGKLYGSEDDSEDA